MTSIIWHFGRDELTVLDHDRSGPWQDQVNSGGIGIFIFFPTCLLLCLRIYVAGTLPCRLGKGNRSASFSWQHGIWGWLQDFWLPLYWNAREEAMEISGNSQTFLTIKLHCSVHTTYLILVHLCHYHQVDTYGLCAIVHMMLHNSYMEIEKKASPDGGLVYLPKLSFKRYVRIFLHWQ